MNVTENPGAGLSPSLCAALLAARENGTTLYRAGRDLEYGHVSAATLRALDRRGLIGLVWVTVEVRSHSGLFYKGRRVELDHGKLTERGLAVRTWLLAQRAATSL